MSRFPPHQFHNPNYGPRHPGGNGQFMQGPRGFPGPQQFPNFHHEGARFQGPPHGHGMPPEQFFHRGPRPPYRGRGGRGGRHDGFPMPAQGRGPPHSQHHGGGFGHQNFFEEQFNPQMGDQQMFHRPNNFNAINRGRGRGNHSNFNSNLHKQFGQQKGPKGEKKKKIKKVKPPQDINYSHYCDICDKGFQSDEELKGHIAEHVKCKDKDCKFVGHPRIVKMHHKLHHSPGSKKMRWLDTADDIQKWKNDRKRNFPTAENIAKKGQMMEQRETQGNVLNTKQFGKWKKTRRGKKRREAQNKHQSHEPGIENREAAEPTNSEEVPPKKRKTDDGEDQPSPAAQEHGAKVSDPTQPSQGLETDHSIPSSSSGHSGAAGHPGSVREEDCDPLSLLASVDNDSGDEDADGTEGVYPVVEVAPKGTFGALVSLATCYDSDSDESFVEETDNTTKEQESSAQEIHVQDEDEKQSPAEESTNPTTPSEAKQAVIPAKDEDETRCHGSGMRDESMDVGSEEQEQGRRLSRKDRRKQKKAPNARGKRGESRAEQKKGTLLEMLLATEIRKERNIVLQCVRQVVKNNFFQDPAH